MLKTLMRVVGLVMILALLSYVATVHSGEGDWPAASLQIRVLDISGLPIEGAMLSVWRENKPATEFQQAFCYSSDFTSNKEGTIDLLVKPLHWTSTHWRLFWFLPFKQSTVNFEVRLVVPGFESARVPLHTMLNTATFKGRRPVNDAEFKRGFAIDEIDVLNAKVVLKKQ